MDKYTNHEVKTLKELLEEKAVNKTKLAERMGIGRATLSSWENGDKVPAFNNAIKLAAELQVSLKTLAASLGFDASGVPADIVEMRQYQAQTKAIDDQQQGND